MTLFLIKEGVRPQVSKSERLTGKTSLCLFALSGLGSGLFFTTLVIPIVQRLNRPDSGAVY